jgi:hypothetical protein
MIDGAAGSDVGDGQRGAGETDGNGANSVDAGDGRAMDGSSDAIDRAIQPDGDASVVDGSASDSQAEAPTVVDLGIADYSSGQKGPFARNPWDMTYFQGRLYIGQGNSDNGGSPDLNAGPVKIVSLTPGVSGFKYEGASGASTLPEQQIDVIRSIGGALYIPGHDPELAYTIRTLYTRTSASTTWTQYTSTNAAAGALWGVHCYDVVGFENKLFSCGDTFAISADGGHTWANGGTSPRCSSLLTIGGKLYGATFGPLAIYEYDPSSNAFTPRDDMTSSSWSTYLPSIQISDPSKSTLKIVRHVEVGAASLYLGGVLEQRPSNRNDGRVPRSLVRAGCDRCHQDDTGERASVGSRRPRKRRLSPHELQDGGWRW